MEQDINCKKEKELFFSYVEDNLKEELYRYKKYLVLKRKRATKIKVVNK